VTTNRCRSIGAWILAARPKTLPAAASPVILGSGLAAAYGAPLLPWTPIILICALLLQTGANLANDFWDAQKGADAPGERLGPIRATSAGLLPPRSVFWATVVVLGFATICGLPLVLLGGTPILLIGIASIAAAVLYTAGPFPLAYLGLGDACALLFFGIIPTAGTAYVLTLNWLPLAWFYGFIPGSYAVALIAINNLRDRAGDARVGKRTLVVRFGAHFARAEICFSLLLPVGLATALLPLPLTLRACLSTFGILLSLPTIVPILKGCDGRELNLLLPRVSFAELVFCTACALLLQIHGLAS